MAPRAEADQWAQRRDEEVIPMNLSWRLKGACRGLDPAIFYPTSEEDAGFGHPGVGIE